MVNSITEEAWKGPEEGDCDTDALEVRGLMTGFTSLMLISESSLLVQ